MSRPRYPAPILLGFLICLGCGGQRGGNSPGGAPMTIQLTSTAFTEGQAIPRKYTGDGPDVSPPLQWDKVPDKAQSFALICDDPDAPRGTWVHWVVFNIPAAARKMDEGVAAGKKEL